MNQSEITEIIERYNKEEAFLDQQWKEKNLNAQESEHVLHYGYQIENPTIKVAKQRNKELLKELELVKAKLRSKSIFSPTEINWDAICARYQEAPALPIILWRCHPRS